MTFLRVVAVGASAGGVAALRTLVAALPHDFAAPLVVVQHIGNHRSILPELLSRSGTLPAVHARDGDRLQAGRIHVAPSDCHLEVEDGVLRLHHGPKENFTRPAIDPLFRSVALAHGTAAVGVVLTGGLDDGTAGLQAIKARGGVAIVQDPATAEEPGMPASASNYAEPDHVLPLESIAPLLAALAREAPPAAHPARTAAAEAVAFEHRLHRMNGDPMQNLSRIATPSGFVCPECHGSLWAMTGAAPPRFRCYTGHVYSLEALRHAQGEGADAAMWNALRALDEKHALFKLLAAEAVDAQVRERRLATAEETLEVARRLRGLIERQPGGSTEGPGS